MESKIKVLRQLSLIQKVADLEDPTSVLVFLSLDLGFGLGVWKPSEKFDKSSGTDALKWPTMPVHLGKNMSVKCVN